THVDIALAIDVSGEANASHVCIGEAARRVGGCVVEFIGHVAGQGHALRHTAREGHGVVESALAVRGFVELTHKLSRAAFEAAERKVYAHQATSLRLSLSATLRQNCLRRRESLL